MKWNPGRDEVHRDDGECVMCEVFVGQGAGDLCARCREKHDKSDRVPRLICQGAPCPHCGGTVAPGEMAFRMSQKYEAAGETWRHINCKAKVSR